MYVTGKFFSTLASIFLLIDLREFFLRFWVGGGEGRVEGGGGAKGDITCLCLYR